MRKKGAGIGYFIDNGKTDVHVNLEDVIKYIKNFTKIAIKDFEYKRAEHISELLDYGEDVDIRFEQEWTRFAVKNMRCLGNGLTKKLEIMNKDLKEVAKEHKKNEKRKLMENDTLDLATKYDSICLHTMVNLYTLTKDQEVELKQVETQHQAAQVEYESVKKVIDKNIERSFKTFG